MDWDKEFKISRSTIDPSLLSQLYIKIFTPEKWLETIKLKLCHSLILDEVVRMKVKWFVETPNLMKNQVNLEKHNVLKKKMRLLWLGLTTAKS